MTVRIITDSGSDIVDSKGPRLTVLPLSIAFGTTTYRDGVDLSHRRFYELLVESDELPTTGQVTPYAFETAIRAAREAGEEVVVVTLSSKLSGTYESAVAAASAFDGGVYVVDSLNVTVGERVRGDVRVVGLLDTLEYLRRGGRVPAAAATVGQLLAIKPVIAIEDGRVVMLGKARGSKNGRNLLTQQVEKAGGIDFSRPLALGYAGLDDALLRKYISDSRALWEGHVADGDLPVHEVGATVGTHVGPGAIALAFFRNR